LPALSLTLAPVSATVAFGATVAADVVGAVTLTTAAPALAIGPHRKQASTAPRQAAGVIRPISLKPAKGR
jgi:hypothetical protein